MRGRWGIRLAVPAAALLGAVVWTAYAPPDSGARRLIRKADWAVAGGTIRGALLGRPPVESRHLDVPPPEPDAYVWVPADSFIAIAHHLGPTLVSGSNTLATFAKGYALGFRIFEVDLVLTADGRLVCHHGSSDEERERLRYEDYRTLRRARGRPPCVFGDLVELARTHEDARFVLDVKNRFDASYREIRARLRGTGLGRRFIPQIYHFSQVRRFREAALFGGVIFTGYRSTLSPDRLFDHAREAGIPVVTLPASMLGEWAGALPDDLTVLTHPVNDPIRAARLRARGVDGIYTQYLSPRTVADVFTPQPSSPRAPARRSAPDASTGRS